MLPLHLDNMYLVICQKMVSSHAVECDHTGPDSIAYFEFGNTRSHLFHDSCYLATRHLLYLSEDTNYRIASNTPKEMTEGRNYGRLS